MKILHISSARINYPGGTEKVIWELAKRQAKKHKVTILQSTLYEKEIEFKEYEMREGVEIITVKNDFFLGGLGYSKEFKKVLKKIWKDFDVVHVHGHGRFTSVYSMKFLAGKKPFIYSAQGFFHSKKHNFFKKAYDMLFSHLLKKANFCTALTPLEKETLLNLGVSEDKIKIIPGGIDSKSYVIDKKPESLRKKYLGKDSNKKIILYVGRVHKSKGIGYVIDAIKDIDVRFLVAGKDAGDRNNLEEQAKNLGISNKVKFLGMVSDEDLIELYNIADLFILVSEWEGFGLVAVEAMIAKTPVIASDRGSLPSLVKNGYNGFIVPYQNVEKLKERIQEILNDEDKRVEMAKNAEKFAKQFEWENINKMHEQNYEKAIKESGQ